MLTVDSYLAFVITYLLGFAALFQIPLILLIVNGVRPLPPGALMKSQRFVVLGAFVIAAIISPTPDVTNQAILAIPVIIMYQFGVIMVWLQARSARRTARLRAKKVSSVAAMPARPLQQTTSVNLNKRPAPTITPIPPVATALTTRPPRRPLPVMDIGPARQRQPRPTPVLSSRPASPLLQRPAQVIRHTRPNPVPPVPRYRSVDGVISL